MSETVQLLRAAQSNATRMRFGELVKLVEDAGFTLAREDETHLVYKKQGVTEIITLQRNGDLAKAYQVRQVVLIIEKYQAGLDAGPPE